MSQNSKPSKEKEIFGRLNLVCLSCDTKGCCPRCVSNLFQEFILEFREDPQKLEVVLFLADKKLKSLNL